MVIFGSRNLLKEREAIIRKRIAMLLLVLGLLGALDVTVLAHSYPEGWWWGNRWTSPTLRCYTLRTVSGVNGAQRDAAISWMRAAISRWNALWDRGARIYITWNTNSCSSGQYSVYMGNAASPYADSLNFNAMGYGCWDCTPAYNRIRLFYYATNNDLTWDRKVGALAHEIGHSWDLNHVCGSDVGRTCTESDKSHLMYPFGDQVWVTSPSDHDATPVINMYPR